MYNPLKLTLFDKPLRLKSWHFERPRKKLAQDIFRSLIVVEEAAPAMIYILLHWYIKRKETQVLKHVLRDIKATF